MSTVKAKIDTEYIKRKGKSIIRGMIDVFLFNIKSIASKKSFYIMSLIFFIMVLLCIVVFVPYSWGVSLLFIAYLILPCLIVLGWTGYNITNSTIMQNMKGTGQRRLTFYLGQIITVFIIGNLLSLTFWPIVIIFAKLGFFVKIWSDKASQINGGGNNIINPLHNMTWILIIYAIQLYIMLSFVVYQAIQIWVSSPKTYYMFVISIVILSIIFGGVINEYFYIPPGFGGNINQGIAYLGEKGIDYDINSNGDIIIKNEDFLAICQTQWWDQNTIKPGRGIFPQWMFLPSLLFPYYGIGEFASSAIGLNATWSQSTELTKVFLQNGTDVTSQFSGYVEQLHFWNWFTINPIANEGWKWWLVLLQPYATIIIYLILSTGSEIAKELI